MSCVDLSGFGVLFFKLESSMCNVNILKDEPHDVMGKIYCIVGVRKLQFNLYNVVTSYS